MGFSERAKHRPGRGHEEVLVAGHADVLSGHEPAPHRVLPAATNHRQLQGIANPVSQRGCLSGLGSREQGCKERGARVNE